MIRNREGTLVLHNRSYCLTPACYMFEGGFIIYFHKRKLFKDSLKLPKTSEPSKLLVMERHLGK